MSAGGRVVKGMVAAALGVTIAGGCDTKTETAPDGRQQASLTFTPSCGKPGDLITVTTPDPNGCQAEATVLFHPGVAGHEPGVRFGNACPYRVTVPEGARTGKLLQRLSGVSGDRESIDVFTVPCPEDAGPEGGLGPTAARRRRRSARRSRSIASGQARRASSAASSSPIPPRRGRRQASRRCARGSSRCCARRGSPSARVARTRR